MSTSNSPRQPYIVIRPVDGGLVRVNMEFLGTVLIGALELEGRIFKDGKLDHHLPVGLDLPEGSRCVSSPYIGPVKIRETVRNLVGQTREQLRYVEPIPVDGQLQRLSGWVAIYLQFLSNAIRSTGVPEQAPATTIQACNSCLLAGKGLVDDYGTFIMRPLTISLNDENAHFLCNLFEKREVLMETTFASAANKLNALKPEVLDEVARDIGAASKLSSIQDTELAVFLSDAVGASPATSDTVAGHYASCRKLLNT